MLYHHNTHLGVLSLGCKWKPWFTNWWHTAQSETSLNDIERKNVQERFIELEQLFAIEEHPRTQVKKSFVQESIKL